ncbi:VOC family protein [Pseudonocardia humida]|uniref:VOC family protein n=1 Tax=Pseudonocardia humida TaxID=2800819 RepID=A0ABT0ZWQ9_9PSEU|nr:VOC family protein [Pseudonocardia humida]MCO1655182.1 VOC family protein [Pseudonocardia humida]
MSQSSAAADLVALYPRLVVEGADAALEFYAAAFNGEVVERYTGADGRVVHSMVVAGPVRFAVKDAGDGDPAPGDGGMPVIMSLDVSDADAVAARMRAGGATTIFELADHGYGDYGGRLRDPFGHQWMLSQRIEDLSAEQTQARLDAMS